ncbi:MAG: hypothetical protein COU07_03250 [Candidatus Harrisonbacteria bacterium CG10_big_fil_rev_8_21_14_0_10_40_38]|uniref:Uncharacterized protein n=1 Tax=Candidatus Harrisonbacteria bacterium CG10_big_fil_rev_8_21_14_0_10_40_38 TaxID=1974583 RepID=A0A2H0URR4_9BACT|nr:MAG: hypothetical protein COU07_03250 [Candidatus Harrisonbacteria bacterium CG10_big_fil_rev_8_21_14_0_10_40_38]
MHLSKKAILLIAIFLTTSIFVGSIVFAAAQRVPTSDGSYQDWTTSNGSGTHYTQVDETPCNGVSDYNFATSTGDRDSYGISLNHVFGTATITSITIYPCAAKNIGNATTIPEMDVFYRFNGVDGPNAGNYIFTGTSTTPVDLATTTFSGLSLLQTSTSTLEVGVVLSDSASSTGVRVSRIGVEVNY